MLLLVEKKLLHGFFVIPGELYFDIVSGNTAPAFVHSYSRTANFEVFSNLFDRFIASKLPQALADPRRIDYEIVQNQRLLSVSRNTQRVVYMIPLSVLSVNTLRCPLCDN